MALPQPGTHRLQPEAVQLCMPLLLGEGDEPAPTALVLAVLPHGLDAVLGQRGNAHNGQSQLGAQGWGPNSTLCLMVLGCRAVTP